MTAGRGREDKKRLNDDARDSFTMTPNWLLRDSVLTAHELLVFLALLSRANKAHQAWPSRRLLANDSRLSEKTVKRTLELLEQRGLIATTVRPRGDGTNQSNLYLIANLTLRPPRPGSTYAYLLRPPPAEVPAPAGGGGVTQTPPGGQGAPHQGVPVTGEEHPWEEHPEEEHMRLKLPFERDRMYELDAPEELATTKQMAYLKDLHIHHFNEVPSAAKEHQWQELTADQASRTIDAYLAAVGRNGMYEGPEEGTAAYEALTDTGKEWAETGMVPPETWTSPTTPAPTTPEVGELFASLFTPRQVDW